MANLFRCAGGGEDIKCIERPYDISKTYNAGDTVLYNGLLRICTANGVTGDFNESKWEVTTLEELLGENAGESATFVDYIASEYDPTHTYAAGDAILGDNGEILKCLEDEVTGEFDNSKWSRDYLCNLSGNVNSNLSEVIITTAKIGTDTSDITDVNGNGSGNNLPAVKITGLKRKPKAIYVYYGYYSTYYFEGQDNITWHDHTTDFRYFPNTDGTKCYISDTEFSVPIGASGEAGGTANVIYVL